MEKDYEKICPFRPFASKIGYSGLAACIDCQVFFSHHHSSRTAARRFEVSKNWHPNWHPNAGYCKVQEGS